MIDVDTLDCAVDDEPEDEPEDETEGKPEDKPEEEFAPVSLDCDGADWLAEALPDAPLVGPDETPDDALEGFDEVLVDAFDSGLLDSPLPELDTDGEVEDEVSLVGPLAVDAAGRLDSITDVGRLDELRLDPEVDDADDAIVDELPEAKLESPEETDEAKEEAADAVDNDLVLPDGGDEPELAVEIPLCDVIADEPDAAVSVEDEPEPDVEG